MLVVCIFYSLWSNLQARTSHGADADEACLNCLRSKADIGR